MNLSPSIKKVRTVIITMLLVAATNFAISRAESVSSLVRSDGKSDNVQFHQGIGFTTSVILTSVNCNSAISYATDAGNLPPAPRPVFYATDAGNLPTAPRPVMFATDAGNLPLAPRPVWYATDAGNLPTAPRPVMFATDAGNLPPAPRPAM